jgi:hypothetical protein
MYKAEAARILDDIRFIFLSVFMERADTHRCPATPGLNAELLLANVCLFGSAFSI